MIRNKFLQGPELKPLNGKAKQLIIFLHGLASDGDDLIALAPYLQKEFPDAHFLSPNATAIYDMAPYGYQWMSVKDRSPEVLYKQLEEVRPKLEEYITTKLDALEVTSDKLALIGFSQGTMTALHVALRFKKAIACVVGFAGALIAPDKLSVDIKNRPKVCLIHGKEDDIVNFERMAEAQNILQQCDVSVSTNAISNLKHSIDSSALNIAKKFLIENLK